MKMLIPLGSYCMDLKYTSGEIVFFLNMSLWLHLGHLGKFKTKQNHLALF